MIKDGTIKLGASDSDTILLPSMACRHGLVTGATGTGKTITLKVLAEGFSQLGVPVFAVDAKGDLSSLANPGKMNDAIAERLETIGEDSLNFSAMPVRFWDVYGKAGIPIRITINDLGPALLGHLLELTDAQQGILNILFKVSDDLGWELIDLKDLKSMVQYLQENRTELSNEYGNISTASLNALLRNLLELDETLFGEPDLDIQDWFEPETINLLEANELMQNPLLYSTFLLWMLSELYEQLPEAGELDKPRIVLFFDEAHLIFDKAPKALLEKITQTVKLIRSKGVSIWFLSQSPADIPDDILSQLQNKVQHALHAYTPKERKAIKAAADSLRPNPAFKTEEAIETLKTGQAVVSVLEADGTPSVCEIVTIAPPQTSFDALDKTDIQRELKGDALYTQYRELVDNPSAYEKMMERKQTEAPKEKETRQRTQKQQKEKPSAMERTVKRAARNTARSIGRDIGKSVTRGLMGNSRSRTSKAASQFAGNIAAEIFGSFFK